MNLHSDHNIQDSNDLLRVAVVEMRDPEGAILFIAMGEDGSDAIGYGFTSDEAVQDLEEKLLDMGETFDWEQTPNRMLLS